MKPTASRYIGNFTGAYLKTCRILGFFILQKNRTTIGYRATWIWSILGQVACLVFLLIAAQTAHAQEGSSLRQQAYSLQSDTLELDSLSLSPGSLKLTLNGNPIDSSAYQLISTSSILIWNPGQKPSGDSIQAEYRVLPIKLDEPFFHKDAGAIQPDPRGQINPFRYTSQPQNAGLFNLGGLDKQGSISRGVNFGNNQDLSVNSNLNLQLAGKINERVGILAAISDDNIPIQPDGNTQQLQEFDQVYIQLFDEKSKLIAGDFQLTTPNSYFMRYNKRSQGGSFLTRFPVVGTDTTVGQMSIKASAAVSRGKFARNIIQGVEGNQGPYRLRGADNELFIVVISGTEQVFIDGKLLTRGQANDYVIDYNTAEVTFTAKQLITKDKRIVIEFQYSDKNYARSLFQFTNEFESERLKLRFNFYSEQDSRNQPLQQELTEERRAILREAGDSINLAIASGVDSVPFSNDEVLYNYRDTIVQTTQQQGDTFVTIPIPYDSIFVRATNDELTAYRLAFSRVGLNQGNYVLDQSLANGRVFRWVPPVEGVLQGEYEPLIQLIAPQKRQMITLGGEYILSEQTKVDFEGAYSDYDRNTFSNRDSRDDVGFAIRAGIQNQKPLGKSDSVPQWELLSGVRVEHLSENFTPIERFRTVEFDRDWNIRNLELSESQTVSGATLGLQRAGWGRLRGQFNAFNSGSTYNAYQGAVRTNLARPGYSLDYNGSLLNSSGSLVTSRFMRHKTLAVKKLGFLEVGYRDDFENNRIFDPEEDTLRSNSYAFWEWETFVATGDSTANRYKVSYTQRTDKGSRDNQLEQATFGQSVGFNFDILKNPRNKLKGLIMYRTLEIQDTNLTTSEPDNTFLNRLEYNLLLFKGAITSSSFYEVSSGLESRKEFTFLPVDNGQGIYTWNDYNDDGQQQLDEFEVSAFQDTANYIKVFRPTDFYVKVFGNQFNQSFFFRPAAVWNGKTGIRKLLTHFSDQIAYSIDRKTEEEGTLSRFNPFVSSIADSSLLNLNSNFRNSFFFNRSHPVYGVDVNYQKISNKTLLTNGFDSRSNESRGVKGRWNLTRVFTFTGEYSDGTQISNSDVFPTRNYEIDFLETKPTISFQPGPSFRLSLFYAYEEKENKLAPDTENPVSGGEFANIQTIGTDVKYNSVGKGSMLVNFNYIRISYNGETNSPVAFEMLDGLQPGQNSTWGLSYQRTLANNMQLNLNYNGRTSEGQPVIHSGGVQVRAFF